MEKYKFIVFEGIDGSGKTVQSKKLSESINGYYTYEPTEGDVGKLIRRILRGEVCYSSETLALLFAADRREHVSTISRELEHRHVVSDRYIYSSIVYQTIQGVDLDFILSINRFVIKPDVLVYLDVDVEEALRRMGKNRKEIFENREMLKLVKERYWDIIENRIFKPRYGYVVIDTTKKSIGETHREIVRALKEKGVIE
ncbi:MAG TPA: dTMP kinase [Methanothermococcus okinawensis]|nr:dTMP kinase [Methanothermococcus okinawensis]